MTARKCEVVTDKFNVVRLCTLNLYAEIDDWMGNLFISNEYLTIFHRHCEFPISNIFQNFFAFVTPVTGISHFLDTHRCKP
jgi:hypothetical protein